MERALEKRKLVTIITEASLEHRLTGDLLRCGAKGLTVTAAHGQGPKNQHFSDIEGGSIRVESVMTEAAAADLIGLLETEYFPFYASTMWLADVEVVRGERY